VRDENIAELRVQYFASAEALNPDSDADQSAPRDGIRASH
jgi:hypothetical protein